MLLCIPVPSTYACKTQGEVVLCATRGHQEVRAAQGVARCGGDVDEHGHGRKGWCLCAPLVLLPPPRGQTDAHNSPPMPCYDALPCAFGAVA